MTSFSPWPGVSDDEPYTPAESAYLDAMEAQDELHARGAYDAFDLEPVAPSLDEVRYVEPERYTPSGRQDIRDAGRGHLLGGW